MTVTLLCNTGSAVELKLDAEALHVLSAAVEFSVPTKSSLPRVGSGL